MWGNGAPCAALAQLLSGRARPGDFTDQQLVTIAAAADSVGLAPAVWAHGRRSGWWHPIPADAARIIRDRADVSFGQPELALQSAFEANGDRNRDLLAHGAIVEAEFAAAGIDGLRLKGWHTLTTGWWDDVAERTTTDLDVLVPVGQTVEASAVLRDLGYQPIESGHTVFADHELAPVHLPGRAGSIEVHRALAVSRWAALLPASEVLAGPRPMSTSDAVTHLILHAQLHDESHLLGAVPWRALYELRLLLAGPQRDEVDWDLVRQRFAGQRAESALDGFLWLAHTLLDAEVPPLKRRARLRARAAQQLIDHPTGRGVYAQAAYLPRSLSTSRMRSIDPDSSAWATRARRMASCARRP